MQISAYFFKSTKKNTPQHVFYASITSVSSSKVIANTFHSLIRLYKDGGSTLSLCHSMPLYRAVPSRFAKSLVKMEKYIAPYFYNT